MKTKKLFVLAVMLLVVCLAIPAAAGAAAKGNVITPSGYTKDVQYPVVYVMPEDGYADHSSKLASKLQAEIGLHKLEDESFKVVILRPPMIYGRGCKGNYPLLSLLARRLPFFPYVDNERSMLYIENLMEFVRLMIDNEERGTFFPQNAEYSNTSKLVRMIAEAHGKKLSLWHGFTGLLKFMGYLTPLVDKAFGNLSYDMSMSEYPKGNYRLYSLEESIRRTEGV